MFSIFNQKAKPKFYIKPRTLNKQQHIQSNIITFSTCWYILKSKFTIDKYLNWIKNLVSIVNNFNLVIYTDHFSYKSIVHLISFNKNIKVIIKPIDDFFTYKYRDNWIINHKQSNLYFDTPYYGWFDIGYFRNGPQDLHTFFLKSWPSNQKLLKEPFNNCHYIHYGCVQNNHIIYDTLTNDIISHYNLNLQTQPTSYYNEICVAGGFFILRPEIIDCYTSLYDKKLEYYFKNNYFIKDDQMILLDIIITNPSLFYIHTEDNIRFNNWFMFQRLLL